MERSARQPNQRLLRKPDAVALDYFQHNHERYQAEFGLTYRQTLLTGKPTGNLRSPSKAEFDLTESYERLSRALGLRRGYPDSSAEDEENLAQTLPFIAHAFPVKKKRPTLLSNRAMRV